MSNVKPYSWVVRFDVAPQWVADGFIMTDTRQILMYVVLPETAAGCMYTTTPMPK